MSKAVSATRTGRRTRLLCLLCCPGRPRRPIRLLPVPVSAVRALSSPVVLATQPYGTALHDQGQPPGKGLGHTSAGFGQQAAERGRRNLHLPGGLFLRKPFGISQAQCLQHVQAQRHGGRVVPCVRGEASARGLGSDEAQFLRSHGTSLI